MKKYIFKKTAGIMIVASMLCAMLVTGCGQADSNADDKETATEKATEATVSTESKEVVTIKVKPDPTDSSVDDLARNITVEGTDVDYKFLKTTSLTRLGLILDPSIKEIFDISMEYKIHNEDLTIDDVFITELKETEKVNIPYEEEGLYVVASENGVAYDVDAEYIDGKYVFETDKLGSFIFRTEPIGRTEPVKTENIELVQQTITDEDTGIQVSGMLPVDAEMDISMSLVYESDFFYKMDADNYSFEGDYPQATEVADCYVNYSDEKNIDDIIERISDKGWSKFEELVGDKMQLYINFVKDFEILDFESDLTVTLPFDYREKLITGELTGDTMAVKYDYDKKEFVTLEVLPENEKDTFQFKTETPGNFFFGDTSGVNRVTAFYSNRPVR